MKAIKLTMLAAGMLAAGSATLQAQTAEEIMSKHEKAMGGIENWNKIKTVKMVGSLSQQGMELGMTQTFLMDKAIRVDISVMGMNGYQIITKNGGYAYMPFTGSTKIDTMKGDALKGSQSRINMKSQQMLDYKAEGIKVELAGKDTIDNAPCYKIKCTDKAGENYVCYFDMSNYYLMRREQTVKTDDQEQEVAVLYKNYQKQPEGVVMPMSMTIMGAEVVYKSIEINKPVDEKIFIPTIEK